MQCDIIFGEESELCRDASQGLGTVANVVGTFSAIGKVSTLSLVKFRWHVDPAVRLDYEFAQCDTVGLIKHVVDHRTREVLQLPSLVITCTRTDPVRVKVGTSRRVGAAAKR